MIVVKLKSTNEEFVLLGAGYGMFKAKGQAHGFAFNSTDEGDKQAICMCDKYGEIYWADSSDVAVVSVDGETIYDALNKE